jgi:hypothetical protein
MISGLIVNMYYHAQFHDSLLVAVTTQIRVTCMFILILTGHVIVVHMKTMTVLKCFEITECQQVHTRAYEDRQPHCREYRGCFHIK